MLHLTSALRYYLYPGDCDMRRGIDSLSGIVRDQMHRNPLSGELFIFVSRRRNQLKLLLFEGDGYALYLKRLERGTFELPKRDLTGSAVLTSADELTWILKGIKLESVRHHKRFSFPTMLVKNGL